MIFTINIFFQLQKKKIHITREIKNNKGNTLLLSGPAHWLDLILKKNNNNN